MPQKRMEQLEKGAHSKPRPVVEVYWSVPPNERKERVWLVRVKLQKGILFSVDSSILDGLARNCNRGIRLTAKKKVKHATCTKFVVDIKD